MNILNKSEIALLTIMLLSLSQKSTAQNADLTISTEFMVATMKIINHNFSSSHSSDVCQVERSPNDPISPGTGDGCTETATYGNKKLLSFGLKTINLGPGDLSLGKVPKKKTDTHPYYEHSGCHDHWHFTGFVKYELYDICTIKREGKKLGGAFYDCADPDDNACGAWHNGLPRQDCIGKFQMPFTDKNQGLHAGCADIYAAYDPQPPPYNNIPLLGGIPCQYLDLTGIPDGRYILKVRVNFDTQLIASYSNLQETDYSNNTAYVMLDIQGNNFTVIYSGNTIPTDVSLANIDLLPNILKTAILNKRGFIARNTIVTGPNTTLNDNKQRDLVAGNKITFLPGTTIAPSAGGKLTAYIDNCLASANLKNEQTEGLFDNFAEMTYDTTLSVLYNFEEEVEEEDANAVKFEEQPQISASNIEKSISIHPNPSHSGIFEIQGLRHEEQSMKYEEQGKSDSYRITVTNVLGETILHHSITSSPHHQLNLSTQPQGIYFVQIQSGEEFSMHKVVYQ